MDFLRPLTLFYPIFGQRFHFVLPGVPSRYKMEALARTCLKSVLKGKLEQYPFEIVPIYLNWGFFHKEKL